MQAGIRSDGVVAVDGDLGTVNETFAALFRAHYPRLVLIITRYCGDREVATEAVQEAFYRALNRWRRVDGLDDPVAWIRTVAVNHVTDEFRRRRRSGALVQRLASLPPQDWPEPSIDELSPMLERLSPQQRVTMARHYVDGWPLRDIAVELGLAEGTVKYHLFSGRRRLRDLALDAAGEPS